MIIVVAFRNFMVVLTWKEVVVGMDSSLKFLLQIVDPPEQDLLLRNVRSVPFKIL